MIIALDYDDTFTRDRDLWVGFVGTALYRGHSVTFVTSRYAGYDNEDILTDAKLMGIDIVFCDGFPKSKKFQAHVWIDDCPASIPSFSAGGILLMDDENENG